MNKYDSGELINNMLSLVMQAYDVDVMKNDDTGEWIVSSTFRSDGEYFTIACKGLSYQGTFLDLLYNIVNWKKNKEVPDRIKIVNNGLHPIENIKDLPLEKIDNVRN